MHTHKLKALHHTHHFFRHHLRNERRMVAVLLLTLAMMLAEIIAGSVFASMALLADGWHMATHAAAFMISLFAYRYARRHANDDTFAFSPAKVSILGGFASSIALAVVAMMMLVESIERLLQPKIIEFDYALWVAAAGLVINALCALLLQDSHAHHHDKHTHHHKDHNLAAAYAHVLADALTSILAIIALLAGKYYGWTFLDAAMGIIGAFVIVRWAYQLVRETSPILVDESVTPDYKQQIKTVIEQYADTRVADLHIWRVGAGHFALILSVVSDHPDQPENYKALLQPFYHVKGLGQLSHITVEVHQCHDKTCEYSDFSSV